MMSKESVKKLVAFLVSSGIIEEFVKKQAHDKDGNEIKGKFFLSSDQKIRVQDSVPVKYRDTDYAASSVEIPVIILRNLQDPSKVAQTKAQRELQAAQTRLNTAIAKAKAEGIEIDPEIEALAAEAESDLDSEL